MVKANQENSDAGEKREIRWKGLPHYSKKHLKIVGEITPTLYCAVCCHTNWTQTQWSEWFNLCLLELKPKNKGKVERGKKRERKKRGKSFHQSFIPSQLSATPTANPAPIFPQSILCMEKLPDDLDKIKVTMMKLYHVGHNSSKSISRFLLDPYFIATYYLACVII